MLVERDESTKDVDVVIRAVESNQANHRAAHYLEPTLAIETKKPTAALLGFWRNFNVLAGARTARTSGLIQSLVMARALAVVAPSPAVP